MLKSGKKLVFVVKMIEIVKKMIFLVVMGLYKIKSCLIQKKISFEKCCRLQPQKAANKKICVGFSSVICISWSSPKPSLKIRFDIEASSLLAHLIFF